MFQGTNVGRNVRRDITALSLDNREGSQGSTAKLVAHLCSTLKETGVQVEDITRVCLTTGGTTEQEGHLTVCNCLLGQVIVDNEGYTITSAIFTTQTLFTHRVCRCHGTIHPWHNQRKERDTVGEQLPMQWQQR